MLEGDLFDLTDAWVLRAGEDDFQWYHVIGGRFIGPFGFETDYDQVTWVNTNQFINSDAQWLDEDYYEEYGFAEAYFELPAGKTVDDKPLGFKIKSGSGTETDPYALELVYTLNDGVTLTDGEGITYLSAYAGQEVSVNYERDFTNGTASTVCLPFAYEKKAGDGSFYAFTGIEKVGGEYVATMTEPGATTLEANTPYLYLPNATGGVDFSGTYTIPATLTPGETTVGDWTFKGTYTTIEWETAPTGIYGFAGQTAGGVSQGQFVKVGAYGASSPCAATWRTPASQEHAARTAPRQSSCPRPSRCAWSTPAAR